MEPTKDIGENLARNLSTSGFELFQIRNLPVNWVFVTSKVHFVE